MAWQGIFTVFLSDGDMRRDYIGFHALLKLWVRDISKGALLSDASLWLASDSTLLLSL